MALIEQCSPGRTAGTSAVGERFCLLTISLAIHNERASVEKVHDRMILNVQFLMQT